MTRILDIDGCEYNGVWRAWKVGSISLFAIFVALLADVAITLRRIEQTRSAAGASSALTRERMEAA